MNANVVAVVKSIARRFVPASLRLKAWNLFGGRFFERSSIKAIVAWAKATARTPSADMQHLIAYLEDSDYRPDYERIKSELNLNFKAFSCQDLICYIYFDGKTAGFFVDIGAFDGIEISNTYALEQIGWNGICIEPIPEVYALLAKNRTCHKYNVAITSSTQGSASFLKVSELLGLSGLEQQMPSRIREGLEDKRLDVEKIVVNTMSFGQVMSNHPDVNYIDFLSIDVEGGELDVLNTIDFKRFRFGLITIENNSGTKILRHHMNQNGYDVFLDLGVDLMFVPR